MFGYIVVNKPELKIKDFDTYQSFYCGLCKALHEDFGRRGQLTLNFDLTFLAILLTALYEPKDQIVTERCVVHPLHCHVKRDNAYIRYAEMCIRDRCNDTDADITVYVDVEDVEVRIE